MWIHSRTATVFLCVQNDTVCETTGSLRHKKWAPIKRIHQKSSVIHTNTIYIHVCLDSERAPCNLDRETSYEKNELFRISLKLFATIPLNYNCALYSRRICLLSPFRLFLSLSVCLLFSKIRRMDNNNISFPFYQARPTHPNTSPVRLISVHDDVLRHWKRLRNDWDIGSDYGTIVHRTHTPPKPLVPFARQSQSDWVSPSTSFEQIRARELQWNYSDEMYPWQ